MLREVLRRVKRERGRAGGAKAREGERCDKEHEETGAEEQWGSVRRGETALLRELIAA